MTARDVVDTKAAAWRRLVCLVVLTAGLACGGQGAWAQNPFAKMAGASVYTGMTRNKCAYEQPITWIEAYKAKEIAEQKVRIARQTWEGACIDGRLNGFGTLRDSGVGVGEEPRLLSDTTVMELKAATLEGVIFVNGQRLYAPHTAVTLQRYASKTIRNSLYLPTPTRMLNFDGLEYTGVGKFVGTEPDGSILPRSEYQTRVSPEFHSTTTYTKRGVRYSHVYLRDTGILCNGLAYCIQYDDNIMPCQSDCRQEWDQLTAPAVVRLPKYLEEEMPKFEAAAGAGGVDISGVRALLAPFLARAEVLRVKQIEWARDEEVTTASQARRPVASPGLDALIRQVLGDRK